MTGRKLHYSRSKNYPRKKPARGKVKTGYGDFRIDPNLKESFSRIGVPENGTFKPDPFQLEALERLGDSDVIVSAPTGSGKTWIALQAIERNLKNNLKTWYASPLKALSNSLYQQFEKEFGPDSCGILTGERKENTDAPVIVGTTEILRNQLYDAMHEGTDLTSDLVILDEAHYLSDPDRGVVWEEVLIYLPPRVRLLLLSATVSNAEEVRDWLIKNRNTGASVVRSGKRPVPLKTLFLFPDGFMSPLSGKKGLSPRVKKFVASGSKSGKFGRQNRPEFGDIISGLRKNNLLPAIFFLKSRMDCDNAVRLVDPVSKKDERIRKIKNEVDDFLKQYPHLEGHRHLGILTNSLVASHHAGHLPFWKVLIEKMMNKGYLEAIFSTSTVAAGVNFPARTVVLLQSDKFNGKEFSDLTSTDLHQMTGRAGRRGMDNIGFALVLPGIHQDPRLINDLMMSPPEPLTSQIKINFSMALNLLLSHHPDEIKTLLELSFAKYQQKSDKSWLKNYLKDITDALAALLPESNCDNNDPFEVMELINRRTDLKREKRQAKKSPHKMNKSAAFKPFLEKGRIFRAKNGSDFILIKKYLHRGRVMCAGLEIGRNIRMKRGMPKLRKVSAEKIEFLYHKIIALPDLYDIQALQDLLDSVEFEEFEILNTQDSQNTGSEDRQKEIDQKIKSLPCSGCGVLKFCNPRKNKPLGKALNNFRSIAHMIDGVGDTLWINFKRHVRFLRETGFVDEEGRLTPDGIWASKLRLDQPLLIAEAIRNNGFKDVSPELLAGLIALFVWDRTQDVETRLGSFEGLDILDNAYYRLMESMEDIIGLKESRGFHYPRIMFWPCAALYLWTKGLPWNSLMESIPIGEGDMASLIVRTADHLRQVSNLKETHPDLAGAAREAMGLMLREPVFLP